MSRARDFSTRGRGARFTPLQKAVLAVGAAALLAAAWAAGDALAAHRAARGSLERVRAEADVVSARVRALEAQRGPEGDFATQALLTADAPPPRVVAEVAALLPGDVRLESMSLSYGPALNLELQVLARRPASFDLFVDRLQESRAFSDVLPGDEDRRAEMRATVRARYRR
jgi:hypothetical protein